MARLLILITLLAYEPAPRSPSLPYLPKWRFAIPLPANAWFPNSPLWVFPLSLASPWPFFPWTSKVAKAKAAEYVFVETSKPTHTSAAVPLVPAIPTPQHGVMLQTMKMKHGSPPRYQPSGPPAPVTAATWPATPNLPQFHPLTSPPLRLPPRWTLPSTTHAPPPPWGLVARPLFPPNQSWLASSLPLW